MWRNNEMQYPNAQLKKNDLLFIHKYSHSKNCFVINILEVNDLLATLYSDGKCNINTVSYT